MATSLQATHGEAPDFAEFWVTYDDGDGRARVLRVVNHHRTKPARFVTRSQLTGEELPPVDTRQGKSKTLLTGGISGFS